jgi:hypothetical protein
MPSCFRRGYSPSSVSGSQPEATWQRSPPAHAREAVGNFRLDLGPSSPGLRTAAWSLTGPPPPTAGREAKTGTRQPRLNLRYTRAMAPKNQTTWPQGVLRTNSRSFDQTGHQTHRLRRRIREWQQVPGCMRCAAGDNRLRTRETGPQRLSLRARRKKRRIRRTGILDLTPA